MNKDEQQLLNRTTDVAIHLFLVTAIVVVCFLILKPVVVPVLWGIVLAVSLYPVHRHAARLLGGRQKLASALMAIVMLALLLIPTILFLGSVTDGLIHTAKALADGELRIPTPSESVASWPLIGGQVHALWASASENTTEFLANYREQLERIAAGMASFGLGMLSGVLQFALSIVIAAAFMATADNSAGTALVLGERLGGDTGAGLMRISAATIRSVAVGVLGIAVIQAVLAGGAMLVADVPAAGVWTLLVLILAVTQLPPILVMLPVSIHVFTTASTAGAIAFLVWSLIVSTADTALKPLLLGRGVEVPMLAILLGAIGGMIFAGILGLFLGAVILAVGQQLYVAWTRQGRAA